MTTPEQTSEECRRFRRALRATMIGEDVPVADVTVEAEPQAEVRMVYDSDSGTAGEAHG